ncbi:hypothetical protein HBH56_021740 [Parastagonospora nodorum]|uniref:Transcription factor domain-containing protein n=1 Tax=Phaeosphaeria nodorum (strain SN15 / ATCC MYA-4574 / FGSC 10173) TaxID=321614 RepID=A0A7U2EZD2_PHANO|nr:hypothetical protein HBH56_021740 [Parastagonospora nodorum]QRC95527.1 hypothetical protein JI435_032100 [Parastagonospora nodorum SN15]KAH3937561.1 hypothetical protein HBH54_012750 [Parastagonospora nodorum]KAH4117105.1 hypothetical protein HBH47_159450 [Parastagonospora nodorum]KAH4137111.1 hypothetical protein HBH45_128040 [Parastagonospora nodorum]
MDASSRGILDTIFAIGGRSQLERIVQNGLHEKAAYMMSAKSQPLKRLERILRIMESFDIPDYKYLVSDTNVVVQAVNYYNTRIYPMVKASGELAPNPALIQFPLAALHMLPPAVHHTVVCLSLNHFIHTLQVGTNKHVTISTRSEIHQHRGAAIRSLSQYVGKDKTRCSDLAISSILMFLAMELQNPLIANWRSHASGLNQLIHLRGGIRSLMKQSPYLTPTLAIFMLIVTLANTCSPSRDQISLSGSPAQDLTDIESIYSILFPYTLCPPTIYLTIIRINHLRAETSSLFPNASHFLTAHDLLSLIESFSPEDWAQPGPHFDEWMLIGRTYQSAAALYCTMALQSLTILPSTLEMNAMRSVHGTQLLANLHQAPKTPRLTCFVMWPLTIAGVEAGYRDAGTRYWIAARLDQLARLLGTSGPLKSLAVLRRYWENRERGWEVCFDKPQCTLVPWMGC